MDTQTDNPFQSLHAYWRMPYINAKKKLETDSEANSQSNPFINLKEADEEKQAILIKGTHCCILLNRFPYNAGHLLILPYRAISDLSELDRNERNEFMDLIIKGKDLLCKTLKPDGFNVGFNLGTAAGAGIPQHLHCHIVPRWNGDHNFMPVIANTRVLPESMDNLWRELKKHC
ncbi:MAG: HIT family hydrolase [Puniceicoccaceae bacterium]|nr:HIT family hydrolase [Puniceicoccaceae bacterium]RCL31843.1 MAG: HIT domain-containing protein [Puniceicoccaceae bacterium]